MRPRRDHRDALETVNGVLVVDKPAGMTSHDVVAVARRALGERRIGHTGTLDPLATGVLPLACGRATRLIRFLRADSKDYEAVVRFGITTDTYDITGTVIQRRDARPTRDQIEAALVALRGRYLQTPPAFSAKKISGQRAYTLARQQQSVALTPVPVQVSRAELREIRQDAAAFAITCSAGFYVRTFAHMLGERTGAGGCLEALRRTRSGIFTLAAAVTVEDLTRGDTAVRLPLAPLADLLPQLPAVLLSEEGVHMVRHGREVGPAHLRPAGDAVTPLATAEETDDGPWVRMLAPDGALAAIGRAAGHGALHPSIVLI